MRAYLPSKIIALKGQLQIAPLQVQIDTLMRQLETATNDETRTSLRSKIDALKAMTEAILSQTQLKPIYVVPLPVVALTTQEKIAGMQAQITAYQNKLDNTTDASVRDNLTTQITTLKKIIQELQNQTFQGQLLPVVTVTPVSTYSMSTTPSYPTTSPQVTPGIHEPSIVVVSPNGGETLINGKAYDIKWTGGNSTVDVYLLDNVARLGKKIFSGIANNKYVSWIAKPLVSNDLYNAINGTYTTPSGQYVMFVGCTDNNCTVDDSDSYFKIGE